MAKKKKTKKCSVEIFIKRDSIVIFDLGGLAIVIYKSRKGKRDRMEIYSGGGYEDRFMDVICKGVDPNSVSAQDIPYKEFIDIKKISQRWIRRGGKENEITLVELLRKQFPEIDKYDFNFKKQN